MFAVHAATANSNQCAADIRSAMNNHAFGNRPRAVPSKRLRRIPLSRFISMYPYVDCGKGFSWYDKNEVVGNIVDWEVLVLVLVSKLAMPPLGVL